MATNEFLPFGTDPGANVLSPAAYLALAARTSGFSSGAALSQELNTVWRQAAFVAAALTQAVSDTLVADVLDDGDLGALKAQIIAFVNTLVAAGGGGGGGGLAALENKAANFNAVAGHQYFIDTSGGAVVATLPGAPVFGDIIRFIGNFAATNATIGRNGNLIAGSATNLVLNEDAIGPTLFFVGGAIGWAVTP